MKKYAMIHKTQCCANWEHSFQLVDYEDEDGNLFCPDWTIWSGSDNLASILPIEDYENEEKNEIPENTKYVIDDFNSSQVYFYPDEHAAIEDLWEIGKCGDWDFEIMTDSEVKAEILDYEFWTKKYIEQCVEDLNEGDSEMSIIESGYSINFTDFCRFVCKKGKVNSRAFALAASV